MRVVTGNRVRPVQIDRGFRTTPDVVFHHVFLIIVIHWSESDGVTIGLIKMDSLSACANCLDLILITWLALMILFLLRHWDWGRGVEQ